MNQSTIEGLSIGMPILLIVLFVVSVLCMFYWHRRCMLNAARSRANRASAVNQSGVQPGVQSGVQPGNRFVPQPFTQYGINDTRPSHDTYPGAGAVPSAPYDSSALPYEPPVHGERGHWESPPHYDDLVNAGFSRSQTSVHDGGHNKPNTK